MAPQPRCDGRLHQDQQVRTEPLGGKQPGGVKGHPEACRLARVDDHADDCQREGCHTEDHSRHIPFGGA